jgi:hypothetical protein
MTEHLNKNIHKDKLHGSLYYIMTVPEMSYWLFIIQALFQFWDIPYVICGGKIDRFTE